MLGVTLRALVCLTAAALLPGCYTNHFEQNPTPNNFVSDAVNNTVTTVALVPLMVVGAPLYAVHGAMQSIATPPGPRDGEAEGATPFEEREEVDRSRTLPAAYTPGWEQGKAGNAPAGRSDGRVPGY